MSLQPLGRAIKRIQHRHHRSLDTELVALGTTLAQWDALRAISEHPDSSSHELAVVTFQTDQSFGALANRMVERNLIKRTPGPGRAIHHSLTRAGEAMLEKGHRVADKMLASSFAPLDASERTALLALLEKLL